MDAGWMMRDWFLGQKNPLKILAEREMTRSILNQTTDGNLVQNFKSYSIDPRTRYGNRHLTIAFFQQFSLMSYAGTKLSPRSMTNPESLTIMILIILKRFPSLRKDSWKRSSSPKESIQVFSRDSDRNSRKQSQTHLPARCL